jgi:hypothetical protein
MPNDDPNSLRHELERSHRRELDLLHSRLDDLAQRVESELIGLDHRIERRLEASEMKVAHQAVDMAVKQAFGLLGVDVNDPKQLQGFRDDLTFGGLFRDAAKKGFYAMLATMAGIIGTSIVIVIKSYFGWR